MTDRHRALLRATATALVACIGSLSVAAAPRAPRARPSTPGPAQTGVIAFRDDCNGLLYAVRANGSGRIALPLPPRPLPTDRYSGPLVLDVTTSGPLTVVYHLGITRIEVIDGQSVSTVVDYGLFAVQLNDVGGALTPDPPVRLSLPVVAGVDANRARQGSFSLAGVGDRLALVTSSVTTSVLMTAQVERDVTSKITGLSDLVVLGDLYSIGLPDPGFPTSKGFTGDIDYSVDGNSIVASIYFDLWRIHLGADNTYLSAEWLTENTDGFAEWNPSVSPDGSRIAYTRNAIGSSSRGMDIHSLNPASHAVVQVTHGKNKGKAAQARDNAMWSPDSARIGFSAYTSAGPGQSSCPALNSEIFLVKADGSTTATQITNTNGTSGEAWPRWGW